MNEHVRNMSIRDESLQIGCSRKEHDLINYCVSVGWLTPEKAEQLKKEFPEIVRCKDCKQGGIDTTSYPQYWCSAHAEYHDGEWFCADGERKDGWQNGL